MINREQKKTIIRDLVDKIKKAQAIYFTDFTGTTVPVINAWRRQLQEKEGTAKVAKKNLINIALSRSGYNLDLKDRFNGSLMLNFAYADPLEVAQLIWKFSKKNKSFKVLGGLMEGKFITSETIKQLAQIPSRDALLGRLVGSLASPIRNFNYVLKGNISKLVYVLAAVRDNAQH